MKILEDKNNKLLGRREVKFIVEAPKNPSFPEAMKMVVDQFKADEELVIVKEIRGKFGRGTFLVGSVIYNSKEDKDKIETVKKSKEVKK